MSEAVTPTILCNGAEASDETSGKEVHLDYRSVDGDAAPMALELPSFVESLGTLPDRILDLLELAGYVYCADRQVLRGRPNDLEYHSWSRRFRFRIRVRDLAFWTRPDVRASLEELLPFLSGDEAFTFDFLGGHSTPAVSLFDTKEFTAPTTEAEVLLFSGGLDSLAGAVRHLTETTMPVCLVSHRSRQPSIARTQDRLSEALAERFPGRTSHYRFTCHLRGERAPEETQRTRFFLYASIAFALSRAFGRNRMIACENGVTSINFPRRQDGIRGRTSRTTHPRTIRGLERLFSLVADEPYEVRTPFLWMTKAGVVRALNEAGHIDLLPSSVSCTKTFTLGAGKTHCGTCFQCVDRRLAICAEGLTDRDNPSLYATDLAVEPLDGEGRTVFVDYVRQAVTNGAMGADQFGTELVNELADLVEYVGQPDEVAAIERIWGLCREHGESVARGLRRMQAEYDDPTKPVAAGSGLNLVHERAYLREPVERLVANLSEALRKSIPLAFQHEKPSRENTLNDHIQAILQRDATALEREHPHLRFGIATAVPDHDIPDHALVIEAKYIRGSRPPSKMTEEIAADITKYKAAGHILFVVYDPETRIADRDKFKTIEDGNNCTILIVP